MPHLLRLIVFAAFFLTGPQGVLAIDFIGLHCEQEEPPEDAGEVFSIVGTTTVSGHVYPRLSRMGADYSGCQILWSSINGGPRQRSVVYLETGRVKATRPAQVVPLCEPGEKAADTGCTRRRHMVQVSFPPGCQARTIAANSLPRDCLESFQAEFKLNDLIAD